MSPAPAQPCWTCQFQQIGGDTFLGICTYFRTIGKENKPVPPAVVDTGCKHWTERRAKDAEGGDGPDRQGEHTG